MKKFDEKSLSLNELSSKKLSFVLRASLLGGGCYLLYWIYSSEYCIRNRAKWSRFYNAVSCLVDAVSRSSQLTSTIVTDLQKFLDSDSNEVPQSLRQIAKITTCPEFHASVCQLSESFTLGALNGSLASLQDNHEHAIRTNSAYKPNVTMPERLLDKLFSDSGKSFAGVIVGKAVRGLVHAYFENNSRLKSRQLSKSSSKGIVLVKQRDLLQTFLDLASTDKGRSLLSLLVTSFTTSAVNTYLENTEGVNMYEDMFSTMTKQKHKEPMTAILKTVCSGAMESLVRTSHEVLYVNPVGTPRIRESVLCSDAASVRKYSEMQPRTLFSENPIVDSDLTGYGESSPTSFPSLTSDKHYESSFSWQQEVGKLVAVPEARQLLLDLTGTITVQGMKTFMGLCIKMLCGGKMDASDPQVFSCSSARPLKRLAANALTTSSVCLALCLHFLTSVQLQHSS